MTFSDKERLSRLEELFSRNFRITRLYAAYLEKMPEVINSEMMRAVTEDGGIDRTAALVAILSELFGLDFDGSVEDRRLIREYLTPSVRILDPRRYTENPYYKNIKIQDVKDGSWELRTECYPAYRGFICHDMMIYDDMREVPPLGFFPEDFHFPAVLENGNEWMTLTPVDLDTSDDAIEAARGKVVTFGLGLGYYAYMCSEREEVESITVVERSADVIELFKKYILPQFSHPEKVRVVEADAFEYAEEQMPSEGFDLAFVDTWRDSSDGLPMYNRMKALEQLSPGTKFMYWIEGHIRSRKRALTLVKMLNDIEAGSPDAPDSYAEVVARLAAI